MKFDIWTFLFQILNFMVLLFVLKRILYKPVREIMEKRRAMTAKVMEDAENTRKEARELQEKCRGELESLKDMRALMNETMKKEVEEERQRLLGKALLEARQVMEREEALLSARKKRFESETRTSVIDAAELFAKNICRDISDEKLHHAFYRGFLGGLEGVGQELAKAATQDEQLSIEVVSAYPLEEPEMQTLYGIFEAATGKKVSLTAVIDRNIMAGVKLKALDKVYDSSLNGQLESFAVKLKESV